MDQFLVCEEGDWRLRQSFRDPVLSEDDRVLENLLAAEDHYTLSTSYFRFQEDIQPYMRRVVAKWMLEVCEEQGREEEVFPLAINYLDRVLATAQIKRTQLQLIAAVCMFIASKVKEASPIEAERLVIYTDFSITINDLLEWEMLVLQLLRWDTSAVLAHDFLQLIITRIPVEPECHKSVLRHSQTFVTMCATEFSFSVHPASVVAASSLSAAICGLKGQGWCQENRLLYRLQEITSIERECIEACQEQIEQALAQNIAKENHQISSSASPSTTPTTTNLKPCDSSLSSTPTDIRDIHLCQ